MCSYVKMFVNYTNIGVPKYISIWNYNKNGTILPNLPSLSCSIRGTLCRKRKVDCATSDYLVEQNV